VAIWHKILMFALVLSGMLLFTSGILDFPQPTIIPWLLGFITLLAFTEVLRILIKDFKRSRSKKTG
jgi:hypothetical protein